MRIAARLCAKQSSVGSATRTFSCGRSTVWTPRCAALTTLAFVTVVMTAPLRAQQADPNAPKPADIGGLNADSFYGKEPTEGVYVRDSAGAVEKLALAQKMERLKE